MSAPLTTKEQRDFDSLSSLIAEDAIAGRALYAPWVGEWHALQAKKQAWVASIVERRERQAQLDSNPRVAS